jgi:hypothetical protein
VIASTGALIFCSKKLLSRFPRDTDWEVKLSHLLRSAESIWINVFVLSMLWVQLGVWSAMAILPLQSILLAKIYRSVCDTTEIMAYVDGAAIFAIYLLGINEGQSLSFRELPNYAKIALLLAFLPSVLKHYMELSALAIWCSAIIAYGLGRGVKHPFIRKEAFIIFARAALYNLGLYVDFYHSQLLLICLSTLFGLGILSYFLQSTYKGHVSLLDKRIASISLYFTAACIAFYIGQWTNVYLAGALTSGYIFVSALCSRLHPTLLGNRTTFG